MSFKLKVLPLVIAQVVASGAFSVLAISPAMAQEATSDQPVQRVEITGSNIRRADSETPSPVQVISADELKKSGYTTVAQVLQGITANGQGTLSQGFSQAFAGGASGISLRGLDTSATLVLIDGHRMSPYPLSDDNQRSFVDISNIPFDAVERIEILKDGASAIYGSDAMAGVVNVILKKSMVGTTVSADAGSAQEGGGTTTHATLSHGWGDYDADGYNAYVDLEFRHQDPIYFSQRQGDGLWTNTNWSAYGGNNKALGAVNNPGAQGPTPGAPYLTNPALPYSAASSVFLPGACGMNATQAATPGFGYALQQSNACTFTSPLSQIEPTTQNLNILGSFTKKLNDGWSLNLKASMFESHAEQYPAQSLFTYPSSITQNVGAAPGVAPFLAGTAVPQVTVPANYPGNTLGVPAVVNGVINGAPIPNTQYNSKAYRVAADLTGSIGAWDINTAVGASRITTVQDAQLMNLPAMNAALNRAANPWNVLGGNSAADLATIFPIGVANDVSDLEYAEFHASRSLMQLPGGDLGFSAGASYVRTALNSPAPEQIQEGIDAGNLAFVVGSLTDMSAYAELAAPVLKSVELDAAARYDHFNNSAGNSFTPKLAFKWTPIDAFALRGAASKGFRAPNAAESGESGALYGYGHGSDPVLCPAGQPGIGQNYAAGSVIAACNFSQVNYASSNPSLQPEKSTSETLGVILEPIKGWSTTVDFYQIDIKNQIVNSSPDFADPVRGTPVATLCADGNGGTYTCTPSVGFELYYPSEYINANSTKTSGVELTSRYRFKLGELGSLTTNVDWTHMMSYILTTGGTAYQLAGTHGPIVIGGDTANPKDHVQVSFTWDKGPLQVATIFNYIGSYDLTDPSIGATDCNTGVAYVTGIFPTGVTPSQFCKVSSFLDTDLSMSYKMGKNWTLFGSVTNLFNQAPPVDLATYGGGTYQWNPSLHMAGAIGRFGRIGATYSF
jgi:iron complex outermembrane receptor protein